ncbi:hypothetical protein ACOSQ4_004178 [Xanthoceras sorbifolium]
MTAAPSAVGGPITVEWWIKASRCVMVPIYPLACEGLGSLDLLPSSSFPSLFLGGLRSGLFWDVVVLLVLAPIGFTPRHLHADRGVAVEAVFVLCVRVVAAGFELWCYWVKLLLVVCGAVWVVAVSRFTTGLTRLNRGSLLV